MVIFFFLKILSPHSLAEHLFQKIKFVSASLWTYYFMYWFMSVMDGHIQNSSVCSVCMF